MKILREIVCRIQEKPYLCTVFFMVLDFKVNKGWAQRSPFLCPYSSSRYFNLLIFNIFFRMMLTLSTATNSSSDPPVSRQGSNPLASGAE